ncbi:unnamed protein product [Spodoptera littoralis]|uniref:GB1/RHD3-type G domain-containing protein n=1 Tax=Spodoptera littoralis TaxID=7109 RepID=A0A9P0I4B2_SPOLI|nr:unnamed protein product [Spodoptera littoralis]CAH1639941.1 unnamed protein product [Spodoptera littoralis]
MEHGKGVQVVRPGEGAQRYELDEEALRRVLLRQDVRGLPVVVVSVAGAFRGGKSFLLNFFLRYLNASRESQLTGRWLGKEDEPLTGFHWRGGCERDTTGIHLWSEPIITTTENGKKVAVLLMDTQGTFDSQTTIGQNSTIFALSTLISSVQIYNLSGNIREDDLQNLQLFTEYGRVVSNAQDKAFQTLLFLVRDWANPFEHPYGLTGGSQLLRRRLQLNRNQEPELRHVREHLHSCFEDIKCFLMPHPGFCVGERNFDGRITNLNENFKSELLELAPSLFDPKLLTPKVISGELVSAEDFFEYFKKYVNIFNSDEVPTMGTIFQATADACLLATTRKARDLYSQQMEARVRDSVSVSNATLKAWHEEARDQALRRFTENRNLAAQADIDVQFSELTKELDTLLSFYLWNNDKKVRDTMALAAQVYEAALSRVSAEHARLCLHPQDLEELHADALRQALAVFDTARAEPTGEEDEIRLELKCKLEQRYEHLCVINEQNNKNSVMEAREVYVRRMKLEMDQPGVSSERLSTQHREIMDLSKSSFYLLRNRSTQRDDDPHLRRLLQEIEDCYAEFRQGIVKSNRMMRQMAEYAYNNYMTSAWGPQTCCFHPRALEDLHNEAVTEVNKQLHGDKNEDENKAAIMEVLARRYSELQMNNEYNNERAVEQAFNAYVMKMDKLTRPSGVPALVFAFFTILQFSLGFHHEETKRVAVQEFNHRRRGTPYDQDPYYDRLVKNIDVAYENYSSPVMTFLRELGFCRDQAALPANNARMG